METKAILGRLYGVTAQPGNRVAALEDLSRQQGNNGGIESDFKVWEEEEEDVVKPQIKVIEEHLL